MSFTFLKWSMSSMNAISLKCPVLLRFISRVYICSNQRLLCSPVIGSTMAYSSMRRMWYCSSHTSLLLVRMRWLRISKKFRLSSCDAVIIARAISAGIRSTRLFSAAKTVALGGVLSNMDISPAQWPGSILLMNSPPSDSKRTSSSPSRRMTRSVLGISGSISFVPGSISLVLQGRRNPASFSNWMFLNISRFVNSFLVMGRVSFSS